VDKREANPIQFVDGTIALHVWKMAGTAVPKWGNIAQCVQSALRFTQEHVWLANPSMDSRVMCKYVNNVHLHLWPEKYRDAIRKKFIDAGWKEKSANSLQRPFDCFVLVCVDGDLALRAKVLVNKLLREEFKLIE
jgi:hypothetical protein